MFARPLSSWLTTLKAEGPRSEGTGHTKDTEGTLGNVEEDPWRGGGVNSEDNCCGRMLRALGWLWAPFFWKNKPPHPVFLYQ